MDLQAMVSGYPLETRQRWYAEMNRWGSPEDFPVPLPRFNDGVEPFAPYGRQTHPAWNEAWNVVSASLTPAEQSLGWWLFALDKTEDEWRSWWQNGRRSAA